MLVAENCNDLFLCYLLIEPMREKKILSKFKLRLKHLIKTRKKEFKTTIAFSIIYTLNQYFGNWAIQSVSIPM